MPTIPQTHFDQRYSEPGASATTWGEVLGVLGRGSLWMLTTLRADGRPHTCPLLAVWHDDALHFTTGPEEQKFVNLAADARCTLSFGDGRDDHGLDLVVEGSVARCRDQDVLAVLARRWRGQPGDSWSFEVGDEGFVHDGHASAVFAVVPTKVLAFAKAPYAQTAFRFRSISGDQARGDR